MTMCSSSLPAALALLLLSAAAVLQGAHGLQTLVPGSSDSIGARTDSTLPLRPNGAPTRHMQRNLLAPMVSSRFSKPYNICTSAWKPIVTCEMDADPSTFSGYQIELFRLLARDMGWEPKDYVFTCMDWSPMIDDLASANGSCMMAAAGVEVSMEILKQGIKLSWPIFKSGFSVMISSKLVAGDTWAFSQALHVYVWVMLGATSVVIAFMVTFMERFTLGDAANRKGLQGWTWVSFSMLFGLHQHVGDPKLWASRVLLLTYGFIVMIMTYLYVASAASKFTQLRLSNNISSKEDLAGKRVQTWTDYADTMTKYGIVADYQPWENDADTDALIANLRSGRYQALVLDSPVLQFLAGTEKLCDLFVVGEEFETGSLALAFPPDTDRDLIDAFSISIVSLQTGSGALDNLENSYVRTGGTERCFHSDVHSGDIQIVFGMVSGLWWILCISIGISLILLGIHNIKESPKAMARLEKVATMTRQVSHAASDRVVHMVTFGHIKSLSRQTSVSSAMDA